MAAPKRILRCRRSNAPDRSHSASPSPGGSRVLGAAAMTDAAAVRTRLFPYYLLRSGLLGRDEQAAGGHRLQFRPTCPSIGKGLAVRLLLVPMG